MGAPMRMSLDMRIHETMSLIEGRVTRIRDEPRAIVMNITGTDSDPNYGGAHDFDTIEYIRTTRVEVVTIHRVSKHHPPERLPRDLSSFECRSEIHESLGVTAKGPDPKGQPAVKKAWDARVAQHARDVAAFNRTRLPEKKTRLYLATGAPLVPGPGRDRAPAISFFELDAMYSLGDVKKVMRGYPKGTFSKP